MSRILTTLAVTASLAGAAAADPTVKDVHLGEVLYGPPVTADQLTGSAVFVEHWGVR